MIQPMIGNLASSAQQVKQIAQPAVPTFSAADASMVKFLDPNTINAPAPIPFTPFFNSPASNDLSNSFTDLSRNILAPAPISSIAAPGVGGSQASRAERGFYTPSFAPPPAAPVNNPSTPSSTTQQSSGTSLGGDWAGVDQWDSAIQSAASQTGVDPNLIKAVMKLESNGDPNASGSPGVWGPMQVNSNAWGTGPWMTDPTANILKGAQILKANLDQYGGDTTMALRAYHGFGSDGNTTDTQYADIVMGNYNQLGQSSPGHTAGVGSSQGMQGLFGAGANVQDWGGFNVPSTNGLYQYSTQYGMNGSNHTGLDVVVPYGTPFKAAFSGKVICAGTGVGTDENGGSCAAFSDTLGPGAGRVEIMSNDGNTVLIYGHASTSTFQPGTPVNAGEVIGASGGENSAHVHVEARVRDASQPSGWRIVDPTPYISGGAVSGSAPATTMGSTLSNILANLARGRS